MLVVCSVETIHSLIIYTAATIHTSLFTVTKTTKGIQYAFTVTKGYMSRLQK